MISGSIRAWNNQGNRYPCIFLYRNTTTGIFSVTEVEAEITEPLLPLEQLCISLMDYLGCVTRLEIHAFSGISLEICDETLDTLHLYGLIEVTEYDPNKLNENIELIIDQLGDDWFTPHVKRISQRKLLKQYQLTKLGKKALNDQMKTVDQTTDLSILVSGNPFYLFYEEIGIKPDGYEQVSTDANVIKHLLGHAENFSEFTGVKPIAIGPSSVIEGKEVSNSQFWITIEGEPDEHLDQTKKQMILSSSSFERWANPSWNTHLESLLDELSAEYVEGIVINAMSETWMMVKDVIEEGISLASDRMTWILEADLEMQKLIFNISPDPIRQTMGEVKLRVPNSSWRVVILLKLEPYDDLSRESLVAARFHQIAPRKGFSLAEGFLDFTEMMKEWDKEIKYDEYLEALATLVKYNCLIERLPEVSKVIVDLDDVLSENRRKGQPWKFSTIRQLQKLFDENEITATFIASNKIHGKIDETEVLEEWIDQENIIIEDRGGENLSPALALARKNKAHYIGKQLMKKGKKKEQYARSLDFYITKKEIRVPGLEPFYDWQLENLLEQLYNVYYE